MEKRRFFQASDFSSSSFSSSALHTHTRKNRSPLSNQQLRDLHRVQGGALLDLVPANEEVESLFVLARDVPTVERFF